MDWLAKINGAVGGAVWGVPMMALLLGAGIYLSIRTGFMQIFDFGYAMKNTIGRIFRKQKADKGAMTPFQAMTTALAGTAGTGNIAGITYALTLGGPGAVFWLWVSALLGMCTKYAEVTLAVKFRERNRNGDWVGGPMYYIKNGLGDHWRWLASLFCVFGALAAFGIGNAVQLGNITSSLNSAISAFIPSAALHEGAINLVTGLVVAALSAVTLFGGIKRLGRATEMIVPFMTVVYLLACVIVICAHSGAIWQVFAAIFRDAFSPRAAIGGAAGAAVTRAVTWGLKRGVFSHEAGLGSAPIAHASTSEADPVRQGLFGIFEVFADTIVICTITALTLLVSGVDIDAGAQAGAALNIEALATVFGGRLASVIIAACTTLFAFATVLGWSLYGTRCAEFLFGSRSIRAYQVIFIAVIVVGATMNLKLAWDISDTLNGLMAMPNLAALFGLSGVVVKLTRRHFDRL